MLVKVRSKATGNEGFITQKAYNLAKKSYAFLGNAEDGADLYDPNGTSNQPVAQTQSETSQSPNQKAQAEEKEEVAAPVVDKKQPKQKPGPKSKKNSSPTPVVEV